MTMTRDLKLDEVILVTVYKRLRKLQWNRTHTADSLGISIRGLRNYIKSLIEIGFTINANESHLVNFKRYNGNKEIMNKELEIDETC